VFRICCRERTAGAGGVGGDAAAGRYAVEDSQADRRPARADAGAGGGLRSGVGLQALAQGEDRSDGAEAGEAQRGAASSAEAAPPEGAAAGAAGAGPGGAPLTVDWTSWLKQRMSCARPCPRVPAASGGPRGRAWSFGLSRHWRCLQAPWDARSCQAG